MRKFLVFIAVVLAFLGCDNKANNKQNLKEQPQEKSIKIEQNRTANTTRISITKGETLKNDDNKFIKYDMHGERKVDFNLNNENNESTRNIVAYSRIKTPYESINFNLMKKRLGRDFILHCSACHDDYANGIIGPSLLRKTSDEIVDMIKKYKFKEKPNALMVQLVNQMSDEHIKKLADEIYEFNKQFREQK